MLGLEKERRAIRATRSKRRTQGKEKKCFYPKLRQSPDHVTTAVLDESAGNHLKSLSNSLVGPLANTLNGLGLRSISKKKKKKSKERKKYELVHRNCLTKKRGHLLMESNRHGHFGGTTSGEKVGVKHDIASHKHCVVQVPLNLIQNILGSSAKKESAGLGILALDNEREVIIANFVNIEETGLGANVRLLDLIGTMADGGTARPICVTKG